MKKIPKAKRVGPKRAKKATAAKKQSHLDNLKLES
jgi:hypothetical protein